jgi:fructose-1,6-bisphosphatase II / sedoheptulose-1,7-bisphosphatase
MSDSTVLDRNLSIDAVRVTEIAAISAARLMGHGDERAADQAAVEAMHSALNSIIMDGIICIGDGSQGDTEKFYSGDNVGTGIGPKVDVAVVPLEGKSIVTRSQTGTLSYIKAHHDFSQRNIND